MEKLNEEKTWVQKEFGGPAGYILAFLAGVVVTLLGFGIFFQGMATGLSALK